MKKFSLRYTLLTYRLDQLWFPLAFLLLFSAIAFLLPDKILNIYRAYSGCALPLVAGFMAAYSILEDPALELHFSTPVQSSQLILERLGLIFIVHMLCAFGYQVVAQLLGMDFSYFGNRFELQLCWLIPTVTMMALGCTGSLIAAQPVSGALLVGILWLLQIMFRDWFSQTLIARNLFLFMGAFYPENAILTQNQVSLLILTSLLVSGSWLLLKRQERYL